MSKNKVYVLTGAAGSGKTTVQQYLMDHYQMAKVITHTTRAPRANEQDTVDYYFETPTSFENNHYLESVDYSGKRYGSSMEGLKRAWQKNSNACIVLDTAGAITYANELKSQAVIIYLQVRDTKTLVHRMQTRGDQADVIEQRLHSDENQRDLHLPAALINVAHVINNDDWQSTKQQVDQIVAQTTLTD